MDPDPLGDPPTDSDPPGTPAPSPPPAVAGRGRVRSRRRRPSPRAPPPRHGPPGLLLLVLGAGAAALSLEPVVWHTRNRRFLAAGGYVLYPQIGDRLDVVCPGAGGAGGLRVLQALPRGGRRGALPRAPAPAPAPLLTCDRPQRELRATIKFQEFSPSLWGHEFRRLRDYYIITTSDGTPEGLENRQGGLRDTGHAGDPARRAATGGGAGTGGGGGGAATGQDRGAGPSNGTAPPPPPAPPPFLPGGPRGGRRWQRWWGRGGGALLVAAAPPGPPKEF
ncbi:ephrin-B3 [Anser cygnoides]|uniref:ephrin-B3 n=1 Tax=Anser cygnoides TaxID=8845 RepID=UPI0034D303F2